MTNPFKRGGSNKPPEEKSPSLENSSNPPVKDPPITEETPRVESTYEPSEMVIKEYILQKNGSVSREEAIAALKRANS